MAMLQGMLTVAEKVLILFLMIGVGVVLAKKKVITDIGVGQINSLLLNIVSPCVVIKAFQIDRGSVPLSSLGWTVAMTALAFVLPILVTHFLFNKEPLDKSRVLKFSAIYSNSGFMGLPLVQAILGEPGVIYASIFIAIFNMVSWTHGYALMSGGQKQPLKKIVLNPGTLGVLIGLPLFLFSIDLPTPIYTVVDSFAALNTPVAMVCIGVYIASVKLKDAFTELRVYKACFFRLVLFPALFFVILIPFHPPYLAFVSLTIQASAPAAAVTSIFASKCGRDAALASKIVAISTLLSILTMPVFTSLATTFCT